MSSPRPRRARGRPPLRLLALVPLLAGLAGCDLQVLEPAGDVARQQAHLLIVSTILMLLIIVPVMALTILFAWRYRASNKEASYKPDWDHSTRLELVIWSAPLLIIIMLGAITWISTHTLDPYRRLGRLAPGQAVPAGTKPLEIDVVALDWKWLFIYPEQGIATVNQLALPTNREISFRITASSVMNSFYIPALAGQIYAMPGMETKLHAVLNQPGRFEGFSANYSGAGFSGMHFTTAGLDAAGFDAWVKTMKASQGTLDTPTYLALEKPSENVPPAAFASFDPALFDRIVNRCAAPGEACISDLMKKDMQPPVIEGEKGKAEGAMPGMAMPAPGGAKGALLKSPSELGTAPRTPDSAPKPHPAGSAKPGSDANRTMTRWIAPALPGRAASAQS